jgi:hypothetical protein
MLLNDEILNESCDSTVLSPLTFNHQRSTINSPSLPPGGPQ